MKVLLSDVNGAFTDDGDAGRGTSLISNHPKRVQLWVLIQNNLIRKSRRTHNDNCLD